MRKNDPHLNEHWQAAKSSEDKARVIENDPRLLRWRFTEAHSCLLAQYRSGIARVDFATKRAYLRDSRYFLQFAIRENPEAPESYENQQTSLGDVTLMRLYRAGNPADLEALRHDRLTEALESMFE